MPTTTSPSIITTSYTIITIATDNQKYPSEISSYAIFNSDEYRKFSISLFSSLYSYT